MRLSHFAKNLGLGAWLLLGAALGSASAAIPAITSAAAVAITYDAGNAGDGQFAYRIVATESPTAYDATGLPPDAVLNRATGWINGSRTVPGTYEVAISATNGSGTGVAIVRLAIHPAALGVRASAGVFHVGQTFSFTVSYNAAVTVTGTPQLALVVGPVGAPVFKFATFSSGSGTRELVFNYVVVAGDEDLDGVQLLPSAPAGGSIREASGLTASPAMPVRYFVSGITIAAEARTATGAEGISAHALLVGESGRLVNVSSRMRVAEGDAGRALIAGFVISGRAAKRVLLRAIGPALGGFGVAGALADPRLQLFNSAGALVVENDNWSGAETSAAATALGAFALSAGARDSAVVVTLPPGAYTLVVKPNGGDGVALAEVYDADEGVATAGATEIVNLSSRGRVEGDAGALIAGFSVKGTTSRRMLVRGIGPALAKFGVADALASPTLKIYQGDRLVAQNAGWQSAANEVTAASAQSGAFALEAGSNDAAVVLTLAPGSYTAVVSGAGAASGAALVEVYELAAGS